MKTPKMVEAISYIGDDLVSGAITYTRKKKDGWIRWGAMAACLCLVVCISVFRPWENEYRTGVGGNDVGSIGQLPDGVDPIIASKAVYPAEENLTDVENATIEDIHEADMKNLYSVGEYVPTELPEGYEFVIANLYETTMKNGTQYRLLRMTYGRSPSSRSSPIIIDGDTEKEVQANTPTYEETITVSIWDHKPDTERDIYTPETLPEDISSGRTFHISVGDVYVGISVTGATNEDAMLLLNSIMR